MVGGDFSGPARRSNFGSCRPIQEFAYWTLRRRHYCCARGRGESFGGHIAALASSGATQLYEFLDSARKGTLYDSLPHDPSIQVTQLLKDVAAIYADPNNPDKFCLGHPYSHWSSYLKASTAEQLSKTAARIFIAVGGADTTDASQSFDVLCSTLLNRQKAVTAKILDGADHAFQFRNQPARDGYEESTLLSAIGSFSKWQTLDEWRCVYRPLRACCRGARKQVGWPQSTTRLLSAQRALLDCRRAGKTAKFTRLANLSPAIRLTCLVRTNGPGHIRESANLSSGRTCRQTKQRNCQDSSCHSSGTPEPPHGFSTASSLPSFPLTPPPAKSRW